MNVLLLTCALAMAPLQDGGVPQPVEVVPHTYKIMDSPRFYATQQEIAREEAGGHTAQDGPSLHNRLTNYYFLIIGFDVQRSLDLATMQVGAAPVYDEAGGIVEPEPGVIEQFPYFDDPDCPSQPRVVLGDCNGNHWQVNYYTDWVQHMGHGEDKCWVLLPCGCFLTDPVWVRIVYITETYQDCRFSVCLACEFSEWEDPEVWCEADEPWIIDDPCNTTPLPSN